MWAVCTPCFGPLMEVLLMRTSMLATFLATSFCAVLTPACGGGDDGVSVNAGTDEEELRGSKIYECRRSGMEDDALKRFELILKNGQAKVIDLSKDALVPDTGRLDADYNPTAQYAGASRYAGFGDLVNDMNSDLASIELIVSSEVQGGEESGKLWIRMSGHGGSTHGATCTKKASLLTVKPAVKSRLACDLDRIICGGGAPPGETCLADLFVQQTSTDTAKIRLRWYDHFGVRATERFESIAVSDDLSRTTKAVKGAWEGRQLELKHRAGITYTGKFTLPDGRSETVKCNDLAMLD